MEKDADGFYTGTPASPPAAAAAAAVPEGASHLVIASERLVLLKYLLNDEPWMSITVRYGYAGSIYGGMLEWMDSCCRGACG